MVQRLHLVFGGDLVDLARPTFKDVNKIDLVGIFPNYQSAYNAWKDASHKTVDNAERRYFIAHLHRLRNEEEPGSPTAEMG